MPTPRVNKNLKRVIRWDGECEWQRVTRCRLLLFSLGILSSRESAMLRKRVEKRYPDVFPPLSADVKAFLRLKRTKAR